MFTADETGEKGSGRRGERGKGEEPGLSNKKWEKAIKGLTGNKLAKVEKTEESLFVSLIKD